MQMVLSTRTFERANLSQAERNELATILPRIAAAYRERRKR